MNGYSGSANRRHSNGVRHTLKTTKNFKNLDLISGISTLNDTSILDSHARQTNGNLYSLDHLLNVNTNGQGHGSAHNNLKKGERLMIVRVNRTRFFNNTTLGTVTVRRHNSVIKGRLTHQRVIMTRLATVINLNRGMRTHHHNVNIIRHGRKRSTRNSHTSRQGNSSRLRILLRRLRRFRGNRTTYLSFPRFKLAGLSMCCHVFLPEPGSVRGGRTLLWGYQGRSWGYAAAPRPGIGYNICVGVYIMSLYR